MKSLALAQYLLPRRGAVSGPRLERYERAFAGAVGARHALGFWKGRVAFYAALRALGVGRDDEIVMPAYTCMVIPAAAQHLGARNVYVDIEPVYCSIDPAKIAPAMTARTKALMIQHTYGYPSAAVDEVLSLARQGGIPVIEDCCHALGTRVGGRHVGTLGLAGFFSSQWSKPYTTGLGGMLVMNDTGFYEKVRALRDQHALSPSPMTAAQLALQGIVFETIVYPRTITFARKTYRWLSRKSILTGSSSQSDYCGWRDDYFRRMTEVQATAGLSELGRLEATMARRRALQRYYAQAVGDAGYAVAPWPEGAEAAILRFPVRVADKEAALAAAERQLIELGDWFVRPLHSHLAPQEDYGYHTGMCPEADRAAREIVNLPTHSRVSRGYAERVVRFLREACRPAEGRPAPGTK